MRIRDIVPNEYDGYYGRYIAKLRPDTELRQRFETGKSELIDFFDSVPEEKLDHRYAPNKWTIKEVFQHMIDSERIFIYRCFRIARRDETALAGFDQNEYITPSGASQKSLETISLEFRVTREASITLLDSLHDDDLRSIGNANGASLSARAAAAVIIGHNIWHREIIKERYLRSSC